MIAHVADAEAQVERWQARNPSVPRHVAFEAVYRAHADAIYRFCLAQLGDPTAAEDCTAEAFVGAFAAFERACASPELLVPWLFRIARNATIDWIRRDRARIRFLERMRPHADDEDVEAVAELRAELRTVIESLKRLSRRDRALVGLRIAVGLSYSEIAQVMGMKENAARMDTARALARIRKEALGDD